MEKKKTRDNEENKAIDKEFEEFEEGARRTLKGLEKERSEFKLFIDKIFEYEERTSHIREIPRSVTIWRDNRSSWRLRMQRNYKFWYSPGDHGYYPHVLPNAVRNKLRKVLQTLANPKKTVNFLNKEFRHVLEDKTLTGEYHDVTCLLIGGIPINKG